MIKMCRISGNEIASGNDIISTSIDTESIVTENIIIGSSSIFDNLPYILAGICVIMFLIIIGLIICLIINSKKKKMVQIVEEEPKEELPIELTIGVAQTVGVRENQQDSYSVCGNERTALTVVADGMGGLQNGAEISGIVSYVFKENLEKLLKAVQPEIELMNIVRVANEQACGYIASSNGEQSGSTLVATYVSNGKLYFASVGDSRIYLMRNKQLIQLNREHIYAYELDEKVVNGELSTEEALTHRERKSLTSYIGMGNLKHIDRNLEPVTLHKGDVVLLASDGVFGTLSEDEMISAMDALTSQAAAKALIKAVDNKAKPKQDNATAVVMFYSQR